MITKFLPAFAVKVADFYVRHPRLLILSVIAYVLMPVDFIPEAFVGPIGYVDDFAVVVLAFLIRGYAKKIKAAASSSPVYYDTTAR